MHRSITEKIKLVIWDLDDTFWAGTLSEGGGDAIEANIACLRTLVDRGIMNSISSKNDFDKAMKYLDQAQASAFETTKPDVENKRFDHWVVQTWNGSFSTSISPYPLRSPTPQIAPTSEVADEACRRIDFAPAGFS